MPPELDSALRERIENTIRFLAVDAVEKAGCGHPGAPMGLARAALELWDAHLRFDPSDSHWPLRDRFILSNGHASMLLYGLLHLYGFSLGLDDLRSFRSLGSKTPGHPEYGETPGVEVTTGPLGQGFAHGVGMALAGRLARARFGRDGRGPGHHIVYGIVSDGDLMEGISAEAGSLAGHLGLGNLIYLYDDNRITIDGPTSVSFSEDVAKRFEASRWHVQSVDGQDWRAIRGALERAREEVERPSLIIARTTIGYGSPNAAGKAKAHGEKLGAEEVRLTKQALGWPFEPTFLIPQDVRDYMKQRGDAKRAQRAAADVELRAWRDAHPQLAHAWDAARAQRLPADLGATLCEGLERVDAPTRKHAAVALERLARCAAHFVGGSADLANSAAPPILEGRGVVGPGAAAGEDRFAGANLHFGVREHAMAAISNGIALDGTFRPYCGTFLIFSDYMRPALRLAALMRAPTIFVFTHDSIFLGEDGPTHQPIEQLDALRAIPGLRVFRPADGIETAMAWAWIAAHRDGPALLALSRQTVKAIARAPDFERERVWRGGYVVEQPTGDADVVLVATGSEVALAVDAARALRADGTQVRVVSLPCLELFVEQDASYRRSVIPDDGTPVVAIEASRAESLRRVVGSNGWIYGIDRFGASAPYADLARAYGFTPDQLAERIRSELRERGASGKPGSKARRRKV
ncbi:MAG TPA: transketolase [Myxococcota bacterium]|nr:transketolase [Myxococcota bacterium]